jgi:hypothetical protein
MRELRVLESHTLRHIPDFRGFFQQCAGARWILKNSRNIKLNQATALR